MTTSLPRSLTVAGLLSLLLIAAAAPAPETTRNPARKPADLDPAVVLKPNAKAWPLFRGNREQTGVAASSLPASPKLLWTFDAESDIESTAAIADGTVYFGAWDGKLYALDFKSGKLKWTYTAESEIKSSPAVFDGVVYFGDEYGMFHAVDAKSGERRWTFETEGEIISSATFDGDRVLFGSYDNFLYCLRREDGSLVWKVETEGYVHGTPAIIVDRSGRSLTTVSGCDGYLWLVDVADGTVLERIDLRGQAGSSPAVVGGRAFVGTFENQVVAVDIEERRPVWFYEHPQRKFPYYASAAATPELVVIGGRDKLVHALDPKSGEARWVWNSGGRLDSSPVIVGERAFLGSKNGQVVALDLATGEPVWHFETGSAIVASPAVADGKLVIGSLDGVLYCFG